MDQVATPSKQDPYNGLIRLSIKLGFHSLLPETGEWGPPSPSDKPRFQGLSPQGLRSFWELGLPSNPEGDSPLADETGGGGGVWWRGADCRQRARPKPVPGLREDRRERHTKSKSTASPPSPPYLPLGKRRRPHAQAACGYLASPPPPLCKASHSARVWKGDSDGWESQAKLLPLPRGTGREAAASDWHFRPVWSVSANSPRSPGTSGGAGSKKKTGRSREGSSPTGPEAGVVVLLCPEQRFQPREHYPLVAIFARTGFRTVTLVLLIEDGGEI